MPTTKINEVTDSLWAKIILWVPDTDGALINVEHFKM